MAIFESIERHISDLKYIRKKPIVIEHSALLNVASIENGILVVYASWSGPAISNFIQTIRMLDDMSYDGQILIVDIDALSADFQIHTFGDVCHGWAEIFIIKQGQIINKFLGENLTKISNHVLAVLASLANDGAVMYCITSTVLLVSMQVIQSGFHYQSNHPCREELPSCWPSPLQPASCSSTSTPRL